MKRNAGIRNELQELRSPLAAMSSRLPFIVPQGYFDGLVDSLKAGVSASGVDDSVSNGFPKGVPYAIPDGYMAGLAESLLDIVRRRAQADAPYQVPAGYFMELPDYLLKTVLGSEAASKKPAKRIPFFPQWRKASGIAAAAVLILGIGLGSYRFLDTHAPESSVTTALSAVDAAAIDSYVEQHLDEIDAESLEAVVATTNVDMPTVNTLDASEIQDYLQEDGELAPNQSSETL